MSKFQFSQFLHFHSFSHEAIVKIGEPTIEDGSEDEEAIQAADAVADAVSGAAAEAVNGDNGVKVENGEKEADMAELDLCLAGIETFCGKKNTLCLKLCPSFHL